MSLIGGGIKLSKTTLNMIGLAGKPNFSLDVCYFGSSLEGFNYDFDNIGERPKPNDFNEAFLTVLKGSIQSIPALLRAMIPPLRHLVSSSSLSIHRN